MHQTNNEELELFVRPAHRWLFWIAVIALLAAAFPIWTYDYFVLLRFLVCPCFLFLAYRAWEFEETGRIFVMATLAILFNPVVPVHLHRSTWQFVDIGAGLLMFSCLINIRAIPSWMMRKLHNTGFGSVVLVLVAFVVGLCWLSGLAQNETDHCALAVVQPESVDQQEEALVKNNGQCLEPDPNDPELDMPPSQSLLPPPPSGPVCDKTAENSLDADPEFQALADEVFKDVKRPQMYESVNKDDKTINRDSNEPIQEGDSELDAKAESDQTHSGAPIPGLPTVATTEE